MAETAYDPELLAQLGRRRKRGLAEVNAVRAQVYEQVVLAGQAGVPQVNLVEMTGLTRDQIRKLWRANGVGAAESRE